MNNQNEPSKDDLNLEDFAEKLVEEKGLENVDPEIREQLKADLLQRLKDKINVTILNNLPQDKIGEFNKLLDDAKEQEIQEYCQKNIPNLNEILAQELLRFRSIYLNL